MKTSIKINSKSVREATVEALESRIAPAFVSANFDLGAITAAIGSGIAGAGAGENFGHSVSDAGDVNGDGIGDLIVGAPFAGSGGQTQGAAYLVFGKEGGVPFPLSAGSLNASNIVALYGAADGDRFGDSVSAAGDVNGDGFADVIVGAPRAMGGNGNVERGEAYVIYGHGGTFPTTFNVSNIDGVNGFEIIGTHSMDHLGDSVAGAGDVNGDGLADVIVGATAADGDQAHSGAAYIVYGKAGSRSKTFTSIMPKEEGVKLGGASANDFAGSSVAGGGDVNGDGLADVIVGAPLANSNSLNNTGISYVVFGSKTLDNLALVGVGGSSGFRLNGAGGGDQSGSSVAILDDLNGDGLAEVGVGAPLNDGGALDTGAAYVVFGKSGSFGSTVELSALSGGAGFKLTGQISGDFVGTSIHSAGDINGDGHSDLIVGASAAHIGGQIPGAAYVVFGKTGAFADSTMLNGLTLKDGLVLKGASSGSATGISVSGAGDVNHDGYADLIVGAEFSGNGQAGSARIVYGGPNGVDTAPTYSANGKTATFTDVDGDKVTVTVTKGDLHNADFDLFSADGTSARFLRLQLNNTFDGANLTIKATPTAAGGDGHVNLGFLDATGVDLGAVTVPGNVEHLKIGNAATPAAAVKSLTLGSLGAGKLPLHDTSGDTYLSNIEGKSGAITVKGDINTASLNVAGNLASLTVGGSLIGGDTLFSGLVQTSGNGDIGNVKIGHDLRGGAGAGSGSVNSDGKLGNVTIGGSQVGGGTGGLIRSDLDMGNVTIGHDQVNATLFSLGKIGNVTVGGSLLITDANSLHGIQAATSVGAVTVKGDIVGLKDALYTIEGGGALTGKTSVAIKSVKVLGSVENTALLGGLKANNSHAQIGAITVNGNWTASSVVAGAKTSANVADPIFFGNADDTALTGGTSTAIARIASIVIKGEVHGTAGGGDHFGFVAKQIGSVKVGAVSYKLGKNTTDTFEIGDTQDFTIRELA